MLRVIDYSSYPVQDNDIVEIIPDGKKSEKAFHEQMLGQIKWIEIIVALFPLWVWVSYRTLRLFDGLGRKNYYRGAAGGIFLLLQDGILYGVTGLLQIPREFLPEEQIFDIAFYADHIHHFFFEMSEISADSVLYADIRYEYLVEMGLYGALIMAVWLGMLLWYMLHHRK